MKTLKLVTAAAIGSLLVAPVMASNNGIESNYEIQNTYQHEYSESKVPEWAEQERERHTEKYRLQKRRADDGIGGLKLEAQNRYRNQERNQINRDGGDFGGSQASRSGVAGGSSKFGKGSAGRH